MSGKAVRLNKVLHGLRQSPRVFNQLLMQTLLEFGLERCAVDPSIFRQVSRDKEVSLIVGIYANHLIVTSKPEKRKSLREHFDNSFSRKNVSALQSPVGCEYRRDYERSRCLHLRLPTSIDLFRGFMFHQRALHLLLRRLCLCQGRRRKSRGGNLTES